MGLYSAVFVCVSMYMHCIKHTLCVCVLWVAGAVYNDVLGCTTLSANLKSWNEFPDSNIRKIMAQQNVIVYFTHTLCPNASHSPSGADHRQ